MGVHGKIWAAPIVAAALTLVRSISCLAQADPAAEPAVLAVAKVLPAVVNINTERVIRRSVRDPIEDFYAQFFGYYQDVRVRSGKRCKVSVPDSLSTQPGIS